MKRVAIIALVSWLAFVSEFLLYNAWGPWGKPELLFLVVIFFNLYLGIRFGIIAAFFCGLFKDTMGIGPWGTYLALYVVAAYLTSLVRRYFYQQGSSVSRVLVTFFVMTACLVLQAVLVIKNHEIRLDELWFHVFVPSWVTTLSVSVFIFPLFRDISAFFVLKK